MENRQICGTGPNLGTGPVFWTAGPVRTVCHLCIKSIFQIFNRAEGRRGGGEQRRRVGHRHLGVGRDGGASAEGDRRGRHRLRGTEHEIKQT